MRNALPISRETAIPFRYLARHVGIFGATGTGKTTTLGAIAERCPCPVLILDAKGDLESLGNDLLCPQMRIDEMGPELIARAFDLSPAQAGALSIALAWAEDEGRPVADLQDLRLLLNEAVRRSDWIGERYGLLSAVSVAAVQRAMLSLERGAPWVFGESRFDPRDTKGLTVIAASMLTHIPGLYGAYVAQVLDKLYRGLGELGDVDKPGLMVMIDEAHLLFDGATPAIVQRIEQITRLIRSKGVGLIYVTQSPSDLPPHIAGQLATRIQHALRGSTPLHQKALRAAAETMPGNVTAADIAGLATGHAVVSVPATNGAPLPARAVKVIRGSRALHSVGVALPTVSARVVEDAPCCPAAPDEPTRWQRFRAAWYFWPAVIISAAYALALLT